MRVAIETFLAHVFARLNLDETNLKARVAIDRKTQRARDEDRAERRRGVEIVEDRVAFAHLHLRALGRELAALPRIRIRPRAGFCGANESGLRSIGCESEENQGGKGGERLHGKMKWAAWFCLDVISE